MTQEVTETATCRHHWQIESPNGPVSVGRCKRCGESREFNNSIQGSGWDRQGAHKKAAAAKTSAGA